MNKSEYRGFGLAGIKGEGKYFGNDLNDKTKGWVIVSRLGKLHPRNYGRELKSVRGMDINQLIKSINEGIINE